jgi:ring-1,2-phenylacetyl-CoA epoxidase subunit PaaD
MVGLMEEKKDHILSLLREIPDPEVPVLTIEDLGVLRDIKINGDEVEVVITPTYSGCPAMDTIRMQIRLALMEHGYMNNKITMLLSPAWTTEWMSESGKEKLKAYGIAPPNPKQQVCEEQEKLFASAEAVQCPHCESWNTRRISEFGSTACKALYQCNECREPFDYFKCH